MEDFFFLNKKKVEKNLQVQLTSNTYKRDGEGGNINWGKQNNQT
jgi:hypothetical protein